MISQFGSNPNIPHLEAAKYILCYLKEIMNYSLMLGYHGTERFDLVSWTNLSWAQDPDNHYLVGGFVFEVAERTLT